MKKFSLPQLKKPEFLNKLPPLPRLPALPKISLTGIRNLSGKFRVGMRRQLLGIDLGHRNVKGVKLAKRGNRILLEHYYFTDLAGVFPNFPRERDSDQVLRALAEIHQLQGAKTATALSDDQLLHFELSLPALPRSEMRVAVEYEVANLARIPESDLVVDYWESNPGAARTEGATLKIKAFAARRTVVEEHLDQLKGAGFHPHSIESRMLANIEALRFNGYISEAAQCAIVDIGDSHTTIGFVRDGILHSCRMEKVGAGTVNDTLQSRYGIDFMRAETLKTGFKVGEASAGRPEDEALEEVFLRILKSIKDSLEGYLENTVAARLETILLIGGGSRVQGVDEAIGSLFSIPVIRANPFKNIQIYADEKSAQDDQIGLLAPQMTTAVGLALRKLA